MKINSKTLAVIFLATPISLLQVPRLIIAAPINLTSVVQSNVTGQVTGIDVRSNLIVVTDHRGEAQAFSINGASLRSESGRPLSLADLKQGDSVIVTTESNRVTNVVVLN